MQLRFLLLPGEYAVCRLSDLPTPDWSSRFISLTRSGDEISLVCPAADAPPAALCEPGWRVLGILGQLDFSLIGILAEVASRLAASGISMFALSTYNTDYILVKQEQLTSAAQTLRQAGHSLLSSEED
jgi:hypothetical protein